MSAVVNLRERWQSRAQEIGLDRETIERTFDPELSLKPGAAEARTVSSWQVDRAVTAAALALRPPRCDSGRGGPAPRRSPGERRSSGSPTPTSPRSR